MLARCTPGSLDELDRFVHFHLDNMLVKLLVVCARVVGLMPCETRQPLRLIRALESIVPIVKLKVDITALSEYNGNVRFFVAVQIQSQNTKHYF
jgi:hypothetical protein